MTTTRQIIPIRHSLINAHLRRLGWQTYIPAFAELLQRFEGTEEWVERETETLPKCLNAWLASQEKDTKPSRQALFALRHWPMLHFRAAAGGTLWDYRQCSFMDFWQQAEIHGMTVWDSPRRAALPTLAQGLGFLRQHCQPSG